MCVAFCPLFHLIYLIVAFFEEFKTKKNIFVMKH